MSLIWKMLKNLAQATQKLNDYYNKLEIKQRRDAVQAMEFVLTASPEFFAKLRKKKKRNG